MRTHGCAPDRLYLYNFVYPYVRLYVKLYFENGLNQKMYILRISNCANERSYMFPIGLSRCMPHYNSINNLTDFNEFFPVLNRNSFEE